MKTRICLALFATVLCAFSQEPLRDPTSAAGTIADSLRVQLAEFRALSTRALVVGSTDEGGVALLNVSAASDTSGKPVLVRSGSTVAVQFQGIPVRLEIASVTPKGVQIAAPSLEEELILSGTLRPLPALETTPADPYLRHLECSQLPLGDILTLIADQTGVNITASPVAAATEVSIAMRNLTPEDAVSELCRSRGLWYRRDAQTGFLRITTMEEYEQSLSSLSEQVSECFTLLYPNVIEAASILYGLYPDRVLLSVGDDEILDAELHDIDRRINRFNALGNGQSSSLLSKTPGTLSSGTGGSVSTSFKSATSESEALRDSMAQQATSMPTPDPGSTVPLSETLLQARRAASGIYVTISRRNNLLLIRTSDTQAMEEIRALIRRIDVPTPMVLLEMKILNISLGDGYDANVLWGHTSQHNDKHYSASYPSASSFGTALQNDAMSFARIGSQLTANLQWLESQNRVTVVASPTLLVANNEVSRIFRGQSRPLIRDISATATTTDSGVTTTTYDTQVEWSDVGTMIVVTPSINADRSVTLRLLQEESSIDAEKAQIPISSAGSNGGLEYAQVDILDSRSISGTFIAHDNEPVAIGGLITESTEKVIKRVPFLGRIPLLGFLFRSTSLIKSRSELVILVTPHVISTPADGASISANVLQRISKAQPVLDRAQREEESAHKLDEAIHLPTAPQDFPTAEPNDFQKSDAP